MYATDRLLDDDDLLEKALTHLRDERLARRCAEQELAEVRPKLAYYDQVLAATGAVVIRLFAFEGVGVVDGVGRVVAG